MKSIARSLLVGSLGLLLAAAGRDASAQEGSAESELGGQAQAPGMGQQGQQSPQGAEQQAQPETQDFVQFANSLLGEGNQLRADQVRAVEGIEQQLEQCGQSLQQAQRGLMSALTDQLAAGRIDRDAISKQIDAFTQASQQAGPIMRRAFQQLHDVLDRAQREAFANGLQGRIGNAGEGAEEGRMMGGQGQGQAYGGHGRMRGQGPMGQAGQQGGAGIGEQQRTGAGISEQQRPGVGMGARGGQQQVGGHPFGGQRIGGQHPVGGQQQAGGQHGEAGFERWAADLQLTDQQKAQVRDLFQRYLQQPTSGGRGRAQWGQLLDDFKSDEFDVERGQAADAAGNANQMVSKLVGLFEGLSQILTPEQRGKLASSMRGMLGGTPAEHGIAGGRRGAVQRSGGEKVGSQQSPIWVGRGLGWGGVYGPGLGWGGVYGRGLYGGGLYGRGYYGGLGYPGVYGTGIVSPTYAYTYPSTYSTVYDNPLYAFPFTSSYYGSVPGYGLYGTGLYGTGLGYGTGYSRYSSSSYGIPYFGGYGSIW
jgi:Spy/CpxP family protein refolding chaperone